MIVMQEDIEKAAADFMLKHGRAPKYILIDRISEAVLSRSYRTTERYTRVSDKGSVTSFKENTKVNEIKLTGVTLQILTVDTDDYFFEAI